MMNTKKLLLVAAATLCVAGLTGTANAQDESEDGHIFVVSTLQWPFNNLEEIFIAGLSGTANAQDESEDGHIFVVSTLQWPFNNLEEIFDLMEETQGLLEQNEYVLSRKVLSHYYAGAFSVMTITEYASLADIEKAGDEAAYPDEEDRQARGEKFAALTGAGMHVDSILQENPSLSK
jgi:hypothetical protein